MITNGDSSQLVTFLLGKELYGVDIFKVQEVLHFQKITHIPNSPKFVEGVIRLRDRVIPIVDLKKRLGIEGNGTKRRRLVILDYGGRSLGVIVDDISKVLNLDSSCFEALPEALEDDMENSCVSRLAKTEDEQLIIVLSPERILTAKEKKVLRKFEDKQEKEQEQEQAKEQAKEQEKAKEKAKAKAKEQVSA